LDQRGHRLIERLLPLEILRAFAATGVQDRDAHGSIRFRLLGNRRALRHRLLFARHAEETHVVSSSTGVIASSQA
jgi:hypothetical protein